jgi:hypothetical protein
MTFEAGVNRVFFDLWFAELTEDLWSRDRWLQNAGWSWSEHVAGNIHILFPQPIGLVEEI